MGSFYCDGGRIDFRREVKKTYNREDYNYSYTEKFWRTHIVSLSN